jgi:hypothetical protein
MNRPAAKNALGKQFLKEVNSINHMCVLSDSMGISTMLNL